jgi:hypothetical protein
LHGGVAYSSYSASLFKQLTPRMFDDAYAYHDVILLLIHVILQTYALLEAYKRICLPHVACIHPLFMRVIKQLAPKIQEPNSYERW